MPEVYDSRRPRLPVALGELVDSKRGQKPFNRFVVEMLEKALGPAGSASAGGAVPGSPTGDPLPPAPSRASEAPLDREVRRRAEASVEKVGRVAEALSEKKPAFDHHAAALARQAKLNKSKGM